MKRLALAVLLPLALLVAGCAGDTDPATNVTNVSAQLNAHGHSTGQPALWWWEYDTVKADLGTANDTEVCGTGTGPREADKRCGPASSPSSNDIPLSFVVSGLTPNTTYYFRACGQDQSASSGTCGKTLTFKTLAGTAYAFDRKWGGVGTGNGQFRQPRGIATDSLGNVYVTDRENYRVQKFTNTGVFISKWGTQGSGNGQFEELTAIAADAANNLYVVAGRVQKFNSSGGYITQWGSAPGNGQLVAGLGVATDTAGNVYVAEGGIGTNRVQKYTSTGAYLTKWGSSGSGDGQFNITSGIATDPAGNVYVTDTFYNTRVQKFTAIGTFLTKWGTRGVGDGQFQGTGGVATDSAGAVYVTDVGGSSQNGPRVQKFNSTGTFITKFGGFGTGDGQFTKPNAIAVDRFGYVYVADIESNFTPNAGRITKFKPVQ